VPTEQNCASGVVHSVGEREGKFTTKNKEPNKQKAKRKKRSPQQKKQHLTAAAHFHSVNVDVLRPSRP
jgi:hypothetical protein